MVLPVVLPRRAACLCLVPVSVSASVSTGCRCTHGICGGRSQLRQRDATFTKLFLFVDPSASGDTRCDTPPVYEVSILGGVEEPKSTEPSVGSWIHPILLLEWVTQRSTVLLQVLFRLTGTTLMAAALISTERLVATSWLIRINAVNTSSINLVRLDPPCVKPALFKPRLHLRHPVHIDTLALLLEPARQGVCGSAFETGSPR